VWLQKYKGWDIGLGLCAVLILLGLLIVAAGLPFYRNQIPEGSPLTRILQVVLLPGSKYRMSFQLSNVLRVNS
jgi:dipeptide/tripeptide permease